MGSIGIERRPCASCGQPEESGRQLPLCMGCRTKLAARPFPAWIKGAAAIIGLLMIVALVKFPSALSADVAYERGLRAEARRQFDVAVWFANNASISLRSVGKLFKTISQTASSRTPE
jgi:hypothetical protein